MFDGKPFSILSHFGVTFLCMVHVKLERSWFSFFFLFCLFACLLRSPKHLAHFCLKSLSCKEQNVIFYELKGFLKILIGMFPLF